MDSDKGRRIPMSNTTGIRSIVHPMVEVPVAIQTILRETARSLLSFPRTPIVVPTTSSYNDLLGQTLAANVTMRQPGYPPYCASIMDGYAIISSQQQQQPSPQCTNESTSDNNSHFWTHKVVEKIYTGDSPRPTAGNVHDPFSSSLLSAWYVTTGAVVPDGCDCVVPIEEVQISTDGSKLSIPPQCIIPNQWIRLPGSDITPDSVVLPEKHVVDSISLGLLLQSGNMNVSLRQPVRIGILSTGNELMSIPRDENNHEAFGFGDWWLKSKKGTIPDTNKPVLLGLIESFGKHFSAIDLGICRDDNVAAMVTTLLSAIDQCDVIITTGGISVGETDILQHVLMDHLHGKIHFGRLNMKPGKPTTFATVPRSAALSGECLFFALPGNPGSAVTCTHLLIRPCLDLLYEGSNNGDDVTTILSSNNIEDRIQRIVSNALVQPESYAILENDVKLDIERPEYHRVKLIQTSSFGGLQKAVSTGMQRSSRLASMLGADALMILPRATANHKVAKSGETYFVLRHHGFTNEDRIPVSLSNHVNGKGGAPMGNLLRVCIIQTIPSGKGASLNCPSLSERLAYSLSGSSTGPCTVVGADVYSGSVCHLYSFLETLYLRIQSDMIVLVCPSFTGYFHYHLEIAIHLRATLRKIADSLAQAIRKGAAAQSPSAAIFENVVGYMPAAPTSADANGGRGAIVVLVSEEGIETGLGNVRGLLKHASKIAQDKPSHAGQ